ncbi:MAG TPA: response regulator [Kiloniellales bacterium]|nr:response regulator [Kiloniellales bacterium]
MTLAENAPDTRSLILCVEDETELRADIIEELRGAGHEAIGADDGRHALSILKSVRPDLILCDISMPGMDGYELLAKVRSGGEDLDDIPFVFLTALDQREEVIAGKRSSADDYLVKPVDFDLLLASVEGRIARTRQLREQRSAEEQASTTLAGELSPARASAEVLDLLSFGIVLADGEGAIAFANRTAKALAEETGSFSLSDRLRARRSDLTRRLRNELASVTAAAASGEDVVRGMALPRAEGGAEILLVFCSLVGPDPRSPSVAVFISDSARQPAPPEHLLVALFQLTPAEAQVARGLARGKRPVDIAREQKISQTTVAFHLRNLFAKTGTNRQADLIALVMKTLAALN